VFYTYIYFFPFIVITVTSSTNFWVNFFLPFVQYDLSMSKVHAFVLFITDEITSSSCHSVSSSIYFLLHKDLLLKNKSRLLLFHCSIFHTSTTFHLHVTQHVHLSCETYFYGLLCYVNILHISADASFVRFATVSLFWIFCACSSISYYWPQVEKRVTFLNDSSTWDKFHFPYPSAHNTVLSH